MKKLFGLGWLALLLLLPGCGVFRDRLSGRATPLPTPLPTVVPSLTSPVATPTVTTPARATATAPPTPLPTATAVPSPTPESTAVSDDLAITRDGVILYPVPQIYSGDHVTFQLLAQVPDTISGGDVEVHIFVDGRQVVDDRLGGRTLGGDVVGLYEWVWDTGGVIGEQQVKVIIDPFDTIQTGDENPDNNSVNLTVSVLPADVLPPLQQNPFWVMEESSCCRIHAVSGTAAARDLDYLAAETDRAVAYAAERLAEAPARRLDVYFVDRVIGQGGYAGSAMVVSYLDRDYAGDGLFEVLVHEAVHLLDRQFAPERITFLAEGVAVWATGGHYKQEDIDSRAAALVEIGAYVPLVDLIDNFYPTQHEIGYLEAAGFVSYLIDRFGWEAVRAFHGDVRPVNGRPLSVAVNAALQRHFGLSLATAESDWLARLESLPLTPDDIADLEGSIRFYQVMRRYQQLYDPTAYFLRAWLPFPREAVDLGLTADLTRHPSEPVNIALETMLVAADEALRSGDYVRLNSLLDSVERVLDNGVFLDPLARSYRDVVEATAILGYEAQRITLLGNEALVAARDPLSTRLIALNLVHDNQRWLLAE